MYSSQRKCDKAVFPRSIRSLLQLCVVWIRCCSATSTMREALVGDGQKEKQEQQCNILFVCVQVVIANYILQHNLYQKFVLVVEIMNITTWVVEQVSGRPGDCWTDVSYYYGAWKASRCDLRSPKLQKFFTLCVDNQLATCQTGVSDCWTEALWSSCAKQTGPLYTMF